MEAEVIRINKSGDKKNEYLWKLHGHWNAKVFVTKYKSTSEKTKQLDESTTECIFEKNPYPERSDYMYGMSHYSL